MRCGAFHRVEGTLCLVRHGQAALSGSKTKAPGFAGGYLLFVAREGRHAYIYRVENIAAEPPHASLNAEQKRRLVQELMRVSRERGVN
jgi:hypothetical protein